MNTPIILDGRKIAKKIKNTLKEEINKIHFTIGLGIILVGNRPDSKVYVKMKKRECKKLGIQNFDIVLPQEITEEGIIIQIKKMNDNPKIHAILVQLPLPKHINERNVLNAVCIEKDVDGFHSKNIGNLTLKQNLNLTSPCTPLGCIKLLEEYNINISGKHVVIIGRSNIVGLPLALLCMHKNATVTICHSHTKNLKEHCKMADIIFSACGKAKFITEEYIKSGVIILDIGINKINNESEKGYILTGDVDFNNVCTSQKVHAITPVPGGIGPMTVAMLLHKTVQLAAKI